MSNYSTKPISRHETRTLFTKRNDLVIHRLKPFNAGASIAALRRHQVTPQEMFFVRNHGSIPEIEPETYRLTIDGLVRKPLALSLEDLQEDFPGVRVMATLQCAGNRRKELAAVEGIEGEIEWGGEGMGNAVWSGVRLRQILLAAGVKPEAAHIAFTGLDDIEREDHTFSFGGSIPKEKAMSPEVILAYEMNGQPLTPAHGSPLRVIVPGYIGARNVKWVSNITVLSEPSDNYFQTQAYKLFPPDVRADNADWSKGEMLGEQLINSMICSPADGDYIADDVIVVEGLAIAGGGRTVDRVEVSADGGKTWQRAGLIDKSRPWVWQFWEAQLRVRPGAHQLVVRAWDSAGNTQPEHPGEIWNFKGYLNNSWHRVKIRAGDID